MNGVIHTAVRRGLVTLCCALPITENRASAGPTFDPELLRQRGLSAELAAYFQDAPRFTPGRHKVSLQVNGKRAGQVHAVFLEEGDLCLDAALFEAAGMQVPPAGSEADPPRCIDLHALYPQSELLVNPQAASVSLIVPTQALLPLARDAGLSPYDTGGVAGLVNYDVSLLDSRSGGARNQAWAARTELGANIGDWIVRSRQLGALNNQTRQFVALDAYAQRTFATHAAVLQAGQIQLFNPVLSGVSVQGVQMFSEEALNHLRQRREIQGIARTQARVEVRQRNRLVYASVVPPGPFSFESPEQADAFADLEMTVHEADGEQRHVTLPATPMSDGLSGGFQFGLGQLRDSERGPGRWALSTGWSGSLFKGVSMASGLLASEQYHASGFALGMQPWPDAQAQWTLRHSRVATGRAGVQGQFAVTQRVADGVRANVAYGGQDRAYRDIHEAMQKSSDAGRQRDQANVGLSWSGARAGIFSTGISYSRVRSGQPVGRGYFNWAVGVGQLSLSAGVDWQLKGAGHQGQLMYLSMSLPLGGSRRLQASSRGAGGDYRSSVVLRERVSERFSYRVGGNHDSRDRTVQSAVGASLTTGFNQMQVDYSSRGEGDRVFSSTLRGGALAHEQGVTFSPYPLKDTFALINVGGLPGVKLDTPSGPVQTDGNGRAVAAQVRPYADSRVQVRTQSLPRNVEMANSLGIIRAGRGAVAQLDFQVEQTRRALLQAMRSDGQALRDGASVVNAAGSFVTTVQSG
ncbi:MAG: fimbria/pilus outer membrane usher protein, partial [Pseudomonas putida]